MQFITVSFFFSFFPFTLTFLQTGHRGQLCANDSKVKNLIRWIKTKTDSGEKKNAVIGGYYPFPPVPETFSKYRNSVKGTNTIASFYDLYILFVWYLLYQLVIFILKSLMGVSQSVATFTDNNCLFMKT